MGSDEHMPESEGPGSETGGSAGGDAADAGPPVSAEATYEGPLDTGAAEQPAAAEGWTESPTEEGAAAAPSIGDAAEHRADAGTEVPFAESVGDLPPPPQGADAPVSGVVADAALPAGEPGPPPPKRPNFFRALRADSQRGSAPLLFERERWIRGLEIVGAEEVLAELEMYLRGLQRYFNLYNLPGDRSSAAGRDFRFELRAIRDALNRAVHLARKVTVPRAERGLVFRAYVQSQLEDDRIRGKLVEHQLEQRTPDESLFLLRTGLGALRGIVDALLKHEAVPLAVFNDLGTLLDRHLLGSRYFRPPGPLEFRHEYDRLPAVPVLEALHDVSDPRARRALGLAFFSLYRLLRDLAHIPAPPAALPRRALIVLALARSEAASLARFLDEDLPRLLSGVGGAGEPWVEPARAAAAELRAGVGDATASLAIPPSDRSAIDSARGALNDGAERAVLRFAESGRPGVEGMQLFEGPKLREHMAERLRRDLWVFRELCRLVSEKVPAEGEDGAPALESLQRFASEFMDVSYQFIRFAELPAFDGYLELLHHAPPPGADPVLRRRFVLETRRFSRFLDRTYQQISRRAELVGRPPDPDLYAGVLDRYLGAVTAAAAAPGAAASGP